MQVDGEPLPLPQDGQLLGLPVEPGVVDRHGGMGSEGDQQLFIVRSEGRPADDVRNEERAENVLLGFQRHPQEGADGRMSMRGAHGLGMIGHVVHPQRTPGAQGHVEDAGAGGVVARRGGPARYEEALVLVGAGLGQHQKTAQGCLAELPGGVDHGPQERVEVQLGDNQGTELQQAGEPLNLLLQVQPLPLLMVPRRGQK